EQHGHGRSHWPRSSRHGLARPNPRNSWDATCARGPRKPWPEAISDLTKGTTPRGDLLWPSHEPARDPRSRRPSHALDVRRVSEFRRRSISPVEVALGTFVRAAGHLCGARQRGHWAVHVAPRRV